MRGTAQTKLFGQMCLSVWDIHVQTLYGESFSRLGYPMKKKK
jgi:hypothetical protein